MFTLFDIFGLGLFFFFFFNMCIYICKLLYKSTVLKILLKKSDDYVVCFRDSAEFNFSMLHTPKLSTIWYRCRKEFCKEIYTCLEALSNNVHDWLKNGGESYFTLLLQVFFLQCWEMVELSMTISESFRHFTHIKYQNQYF